MEVPSKAVPTIEKADEILNGLGDVKKVGFTVQIDHESIMVMFTDGHYVVYELTPVEVDGDIIISEDEQ